MLPHAAALASAPVLAALRPADGLALVVLLAFTWWGARKGALRQGLSVVLLAAGFWAASRFARDVEPTIGKLFSLTPDERLALAWGATLLGVLLAGALVLRLLTQRLPERSRGGVDRVLGGLLGAAKGAVVMTVAGYALLSVGPLPTGPALSRQAAEPTSAEVEGAAPAEDLTGRVRGSLSAVCLTEWGGLLRRWVAVPAWVEERLDAVNHRIEPGAVTEDAGRARPRGR